MADDSFVLVSDAVTSFTTRLEEELSQKVHPISVNRFADSEDYVCMDDASPLAGHNVILVFQFHRDQLINDRYFQLFLLIDFVQKSGARSVVCLLPYLGYGRQDVSFDEQHVGPLSMIGSLFRAAGVSSLITCDAHSTKGLELLGLNAINITAADLWQETVQTLVDNNTKDYCLLSPDQGGLERVVQLAEKVGLTYASITKERTRADETRALSIRGDITHKNVIIVDDICSTGGTALNAARLARENGATKVTGCFTHMLSADAVQHKLQEEFDAVYCADTIMSNKELDENIIKSGAGVGRHLLTVIKGGKHGQC